MNDMLGLYVASWHLAKKWSEEPKGAPRRPRSGFGSRAVSAARAWARRAGTVLRDATARSRRAPVRAAECCEGACDA